MSILNQFKKKFNLEGVQITLDAPSHIPKSDQFIHGRFSLESESEHVVKEIKITLTEVKKSGHKKKRVRSEVIGECVIPDTFDISPGEIIDLDFDLPYQLGRNFNNMTGPQIDIGGTKTDIFKAAGKIASIVGGVNIKHIIKVKVKLKDVWFSPKAKRQIVLMDDDKLFVED